MDFEQLLRSSNEDNAPEPWEELLAYAQQNKLHWWEKILEERVTSARVRAKHRWVKDVFKPFFEKKFMAYSWSTGTYHFGNEPDHATFCGEGYKTKMVQIPGNHVKILVCKGCLDSLEKGGADVSLLKEWNQEKSEQL